MREFRAHHAEYRTQGLEVAGVSREGVDSNRHWVERLRLPYPLLSDPEGVVGDAFGINRRVGIAGWTIEFFRRSTFLIDTHGRIAAVWGSVKIRGHALDVLELAKALPRQET